MMQRGCKCRHSLSVLAIACRLINVITVKIGGALNAHGSRWRLFVALQLPSTLPPPLFPFSFPSASTRIGFAPISMLGFNSDRQARLDLSAFILKFETQPGTNTNR